MTNSSQTAWHGLRQALRDGPCVLATFVLLPRVEIVEMMAAAGFDAVVLDLEHGPIEIADVAPLAAAAQGAGMFAVARVAGDSASEIGRVLDGGVDGVLVPHASSREEAERVVRAGRLPPRGERSINPFVRGHRYGVAGAVDLAATDARVALLAMLEGADALTQLSDICAVEDLDALFVGPVDLSASLGFAGQAEHPEVVAAVADVIARTRKAGRVPGVFAPTPQAAARWIDMGAGLVAVSTDVAMAGAAFSGALAAAVERPAAR